MNDNAVATTSPRASVVRLESSTGSTVSFSTRITPSSSVKQIVRNPYLKKRAQFVGGAENARLQAQKKARKGKRILDPVEREKGTSHEHAELPKGMNPMERFFAALFRSAPCDFYVAENDDNRARQLWETISKRVGLAVPTSPVRSSYSNAEQHFSIRAALVLEEARSAVSRSLYVRWVRRQHNNLQPQQGRAGSGPSMSLSAKHAEEGQNEGHRRITFYKNRPFTREELNVIRPANLFECVPRDSARTLQNDVYLGVIVSSNREQVETERRFTLAFFRRLPHEVEDSEWTVAPLTTLVTELRSFEAMTYRPGRVGFLPMLLGNGGTNGPRHIRFDENRNERDKKNPTLQSNNKKKIPNARTMVDFFTPRVTTPRKKDEDLPFRPSRLNPTQVKAATSFLESPQNSITLVQGPPGTGKTTLLVSIICRYLSEPVSNTSSASGEKCCHPGRLMVCAPTNKAISLLASRFLTASNQSSTKYNFVPIIVGDVDKLMAEDTRGSAGARQHWNGGSQLRSIFLFSWVNSVLEDYRKIRNHFLPGGGAVGRPAWYKDSLFPVASHLEKKLTNSLKGLPESISQSAARITSDLHQLQESGTPAHGIIGRIDSLLKALSDIPLQTLWRQLLVSANVVFSTLASAGGQVFWNAPRIDDLIVDEASAASEPEICIPFHLRPNRLLVVGDPQQLPATVLSRRATALGLAKSLQERLMNDCKFPYTMLDVQYRMNPEIASFPSFRFYRSAIANGANVVNRATAPPLLLDCRPYTFIQVDGVEDQLSSSGSYRNHAEAKIVVDLVAELQSKSDGSWWSSDRIRIITFYQAQVSYLKRMLRERQGLRGCADKVVVATVDSSQGTEADIVIISFVRSRSNRDSVNAASAGFLTDDRRVNVALTRARYQLICVANVGGMQEMRGDTETLRLLSANAADRNVIVPSNFEKGLTGPALKLRKNADASLDLFYGD